MTSLCDTKRLRTNLKQEKTVYYQELTNVHIYLYCNFIFFTSQLTLTIPTVHQKFNYKTIAMTISPY